MRVRVTPRRASSLARRLARAASVSRRIRPHKSTSQLAESKPLNVVLSGSTNAGSFCSLARDRLRGDDFEDALVGGGDVALGELGSQGADKQRVEAGPHADVAVLALEAVEQDLFEVLGIAVGGEADRAAAETEPVAQAA